MSHKTTASHVPKGSNGKTPPQTPRIPRCFNRSRGATKISEKKIVGCLNPQGGNWILPLLYLDIYVFFCLLVGFLGWILAGCGLFPKIMVPPNHPFVHRVFPYFHHPFWGVFPLFLETPIWVVSNQKNNGPHLGSVGRSTNNDWGMPGSSGSLCVKCVPKIHPKKNDTKRQIFFTYLEDPGMKDFTLETLCFFFRFHELLITPCFLGHLFLAGGKEWARTLELVNWSSYLMGNCEPTLQGFRFFSSSSAKTIRKTKMT